MTVLTIGVFDLLHWGHFELLRRAKELAGPDGRLIVGVQQDAFVAKWKPHLKLVYNWEIRSRMVAALKWVDEVIPHTDADKTVQSVPFDLFCLGGDQRGRHEAFRRALEWCETNGKKTVQLPRTSGLSTTELKERIKHEC